MEQLLVCDVCDTLYRVNTTAAFVHYLTRMHGSPRAQRAIRALTTRGTLAWWTAAVAYKALRWDLGRRRLLRVLKGYLREDLDQVAKHFVASELPAHKVAPTWSILERAQANGTAVVLASSSVEPVVAAIAADIGAEYVASTLAFDRHGRCSGKLASDLTGRKLTALARWLRTGDARVRWGMMTDNLTDRETLLAAERRIVVVWRERDRARWAGVDAEFVVAGT